MARFLWVLFLGFCLGAEVAVLRQQVLEMLADGAPLSGAAFIVLTATLALIIGSAGLMRFSDWFDREEKGE